MSDEPHHPDAQPPPGARPADTHPPVGPSGGGRGSPKRRLPWRPILALPVIAAGILLVVVALVIAGRPKGSEPPKAEAPGEDLALVANQNNVFLACSDCHEDLDASLKQDPNLTFRHAQHFRTGVSDCASCHPANTHEPDKINKPTMTTCYQCHGREQDARAPGTCTTCHPSSFSRAPASHAQPAWDERLHGAAARASAGFDCATCHTETTCTSCHGLTLPHPNAWDRAPHAATFFEDPTVCAKCHVVPATVPGTPYPKTRDLCDTCHHPQGPRDSSWIDVHPTVVASRGATTCFQCHATQTCATCHRDGRLDLTADQQLFVQDHPAAAGTSPAPSPSA
ncbi:MAG: cytochrome c3 family protein [Planctomycetaceae bacterium]